MPLNKTIATCKVQYKAAPFLDWTSNEAPCISYLCAIQANKSTLDALRCNLGNLPGRLIELGAQARRNAKNLQGVAKSLQDVHDMISGWSSGARPNGLQDLYNAITGWPSGQRAQAYHKVSKQSGLTNILRVKQVCGSLPVSDTSTDVLE